MAETFIINYVRTEDYKIGKNSQPYIRGAPFACILCKCMVMQI